MNQPAELKLILEATLLAAGEPLSLERMSKLFEDSDDAIEATKQPLPVAKKTLLAALNDLQADYQGRGIELVEIASGYRFQARREFAPWVSRLWEEKPGRYSRALLETLALIAYRQPITRGEIADIRGVSVSTTIIKTLLEHNWIRVVGHRDVPGRPALYGSSHEFLDYFNLKSLSELPPLAEIRDLAVIGASLEQSAELITQVESESLPLTKEVAGTPEI